MYVLHSMPKTSAAGEALRKLFGGPYQEEITVDLLKFKINSEQTNLLHQINPFASVSRIIVPLSLESVCSNETVILTAFAADGL